jgi:hypothetical protein
MFKKVIAKCKEGLIELASINIRIAQIELFVEQTKATLSYIDGHAKAIIEITKMTIDNRKMINQLIETVMSGQKKHQADGNDLFELSHNDNSGNDPLN